MNLGRENTSQEIHRDRERAEGFVCAVHQRDKDIRHHASQKSLELSRLVFSVALQVGWTEIHPVPVLTLMSLWFQPLRYGVNKHCCPKHSSEWVHTHQACFFTL